MSTSPVRTGLRDLLALAESHGGLFAARQARPIGVSDRMLTYYVQRGDLERVAHGIYRVTHLPQHRLEDVIIACLWAGEGAVASYETALVVHGLSEAMPAVVHVSTSESFRGRRRGVVVHHAALTNAERSLRDDVPVTTVVRTLSDVAERSPVLARRALDEALAGGDVSLRRVRLAAVDYPSLAHLLPAGEAP